MKGGFTAAGAPGGFLIQIFNTTKTNKKELNIAMDIDIDTDIEIGIDIDIDTDIQHN